MEKKENKFKTFVKTVFICLYENIVCFLENDHVRSLTKRFLIGAGCGIALTLSFAFVDWISDFQVNDWEMMRFIGGVAFIIVTFISFAQYFLEEWA